MRVYYIRHGMTTANETTGICGRRIDWPLSENGRRELQELAAKGIYPEDHGSCYTSTLRRTQETLHIIYPNTDFEPTHLLDERDLGDIEYVTDVEVARAWRENMVDEYGNELPETYRGGENFEQFSRRVHRDMNALLEEAFSRGQETITICGHGSYLRQIGISFAVESYINVRPIVKNGYGFLFRADRNAQHDFRLKIEGFIGGSTMNEVLMCPVAASGR